ncbi:adenylate/guanylate cyclase domain-containing protein [Ornithinimicrobium cryptoxanthini]|uniref:Adenylate/guanylate cyclase domain-containing protein n=1 Tax=Ornithinimicrobium cryptoxanthini TaxID=2934161 RepID=A0ABY4YG51_9MICO|nr:adenylate/guanylate cyclase domain-containing protein [Ornithinimicrobium cryptoxanthini]USQ75713.1 adenylate/guanylate cyclase domain-containing protein [Ornithinimicrobium cryptoxanthini]
MGALTGLALWLSATVLIPTALVVDTAVVVPICLGMAGLNAAGYVAARWATTLVRQQLIGLTLNGSAGLAVLVLSEIAGMHDSLAAPAILLVAIFAFVVLRLRFILAFVAAGIYLVGFASLVALHPTPTALLQLFLVAVAMVVGLATTYLLERGARDVFAQRRFIEAQTVALAEAHATSERLLLNVLPAKIAQRLEAGETTIADWFDDTTVLFADLVGFTPLATRLEPRATRDLLDRLFTGFDERAERHGLEKIKTIGDAYMAVGGVPEPSSDHPARVVAFGLDLLDLVALVAADLGQTLALRIGIHTGPVVAGVVGTQKFSYDLWGDTVNVASRLESQGVAGALHISETTWLRVRGLVEATSRGPMELKGRGSMPTFLVARRSLA